MTIENELDEHRIKYKQIRTGRRGGIEANGRRPFPMLIWRILGGLFLVIGGIGIVLPLLPTTIFWIIAALCFARSDPKIRDWIYRQPGVGPQVELFIEKGEMTQTGKRAALIGMSFAVILLIYIFRDRPVVLAAGLGLIAIGALVVLSRKTGQV